MVTEEVRRWEQAPSWDDENDRRMAEKTLSYLSITFPLPAKSVKRRCRHEGTDEDGRGLPLTFLLLFAPYLFSVYIFIFFIWPSFDIVLNE